LEIASLTIVFQRTRVKSEVVSTFPLSGPLS
jgi:hypothetical protein